MNGVKTRLVESLKFGFIFWLIWFEENYIVENSVCNKISPVFSRYKRCYTSQSSSLTILRIHVLVCYVLCFFAFNMAFFFFYLARTHKVPFPTVESILYAVDEENRDERMKFNGFYALLSLTTGNSKKSLGMFSRILNDASYWSAVKNACFSILIKFKDQLNVINSSSTTKKKHLTYLFI